jgi:hypothetical protein
MPLRIEPTTRFAVLQVPGVAFDRKVVAVNYEKRELPADRYTSRMQADGTYVVRIDTRVLKGTDVLLEARGVNGHGEPLGCVTTELMSGYS